MIPLLVPTFLESLGLMSLLGTVERGRSKAVSLFVAVLDVLGLGNLFKSILRKALSVVVVTVRVDSAVNIQIVEHLMHNGRPLSVGDKYYLARWIFVRSEEQYRTVFSQEFRNTNNIYIYKKSPIWLMTVGTDTYISYIRGTHNIEDLILKAGDEWHDQIHKLSTQTCKTRQRYKVHHFFGKGSDDLARALADAMNKNVNNASASPPAGHVADAPEALSRPLRYSFDDLGPRLAPLGSALEALALQPELTSLFKDIQFWFKERKWYSSKGVPWRYGFGLYGQPGRGKTIFIRAVAEDLDLPVFVFDLASMSNHEFIECWQKMLESAPCLAVFEDFDNVFHGRENMVPGSKLTFDCVLNQTGGIEVSDGICLAVTTNYPEHLDPALGVTDRTKDGESTRPGRLDTMVEVRDIDEAGKLKLASNILSEYPDLISQVMTDPRPCSAAQFVDRCRKLALQRRWDTRSL